MPVKPDPITGKRKHAGNTSLVSNAAKRHHSGSLDVPIGSKQYKKLKKRPVEDETIHISDDEVSDESDGTDTNNGHQTTNDVVDETSDEDEFVQEESEHSSGEEETEDEYGEEIPEVPTPTPAGSKVDLPWGDLKYRAGRGDIHKKGLSKTPSHQVKTAVTIFRAAWVTGGCGNHDAMWPENDAAGISACIRESWEQVTQQQRERKGGQPMTLEWVVARKVESCKLSAILNLV